MAERPEAAVASLTRAAEAAKHLPLDRWLDTMHEYINVEVGRGQLDSASRLFDEPAWLEYVTAFADTPVGRQVRPSRARTDPALAPLRGRADYDTTIATHRLR